MALGYRRQVFLNMHYLDYLLDRITMYRLVLYVLIAFDAFAIVFSFLGLLPFSPLALFVSTIFLLVVCWIVNTVFATVLKIPTNAESFYITALILALIITPGMSIATLVFLFEAGTLAMATKYFLGLKRKHIFNPTASAVVITSFFLGHAASWWVGTAIMAPFVIIGGLLIVRKIQKAAMVTTFFIVAIFVSLLISLLHGDNLLFIVQRIFLDSSLFFLGFIMLTEPLTTPPTKRLEILYGAIVGIFFTPQIHFGIFYTTPEIALCIGNIFSYVVSPKQKLLLTLKEKIITSPDTIDFLFPRPKNFFYNPGQYMEWTLARVGADSRGNRRYFTLASSPTEDTIRLGVKFYDKGSAFKKQLKKMQSGSTLLAGQLAGEFTLPKDVSKKLVFLAGGIGITPIRSILQFLLDTNEKRDSVLLYANKDIKDIVYKDVLDLAEKRLGVKIFYTITDSTVPKNWQGLTGRVDKTIIKKCIQDYKERFFYLSGPKAMVDAYETVLSELRVPRSQIKKDFFPGYV